ncbi:Uncharacterised protein [Mycobacteroides abscessus]|nr:Uncharacterised protein [Mycobacteroides abscessus]SHT88145.1 Uncharacterised protein [Mycobacteroides abscessus subsp. abscessus]SKU91025.1 Uncharacterised protein [Mycobacteroides abscessus subsp. abscessus]
MTIRSSAPSPSRVGSQAMSSLVPITGNTALSASGTTPYLRVTASRMACRSAGVPAVAGYPGRSLAAANASRMTGATLSTGVPTERSTIPSGCAAAAALASAIVSHGNSGSDADTLECTSELSVPHPWAEAP